MRPKAEGLVCGAVHPSPVQGATSYTVMADTGERVVQFCAGLDALDLGFLAHVEEAYQPFVPHHRWQAGHASGPHNEQRGRCRGLSCYGPATYQRLSSSQKNPS